MNDPQLILGSRNGDMKGFVEWYNNQNTYLFSGKYRIVSLRETTCIQQVGEKEDQVFCVEYVLQLK